MDIDRAQKIFPAYFANFEMPSTAKEQAIEVYRACPTRAVEAASFLNTFEENGFQISAGGELNDPQEYCLSTYIRLKDIKRFVTMDSRFQPPLTLAKGFTNPADGPSCITKTWKRCKSSHVDWWLYVGARPWESFEGTDYETEISKQK